MPCSHSYLKQVESVVWNKQQYYFIGSYYTQYFLDTSKMFSVEKQNIFNKS